MKPYRWVGGILGIDYPLTQSRPVERARLAVRVPVEARAQVQFKTVIYVEAEIAQQVLRVERVVVPVPIGIEVRG